jgi:hypothetical protein
MLVRYGFLTTRRDGERMLRYILLLRIFTAMAVMALQR